MSIGKLWIFGDSFDSPATLEANGYVDEFYTGGIKHYSEVLAKDLDLDIKHLGIPGNGAPTILHYLTSNLNNIGPSDYIVVSISEPMRLLSFYPGETGTNLSSAAVGHNEQAIRDYSSYSKYYFDSLGKYVVDCVVPFLGETVYYYYSIFSNLLLSCNAKKTFLYCSDFWGQFETIYEHTEGKIKDNHWSFNGQLEFGKHILKRWNSAEHFHYKPQNSKEFNIPTYTDFLTNE